MAGSSANFITLARLPLMIVVLVLLYSTSPWLLGLATVLLVVLFLMDWFDGYWARYKNQVTDLGSVLDIALDRVVENCLWVVFAHQHKVGVWVAVVFLVRSFVIDALRSFALAKGKSAFGMMQSPLGKFLVAGRFMRGTYGLIKCSAFVALALEATLRAGAGGGLPVGWQWIAPLSQWLVLGAVGLCLARGLPVIYDIRWLLREPNVEQG